jgi:hypothetical protein
MEVIVEGWMREKDEDGAGKQNARSAWEGGAGILAGELLRLT